MVHLRKIVYNLFSKVKDWRFAAMASEFGLVRIVVVCIDCNKVRKTCIGVRIITCFCLAHGFFFSASTQRTLLDQLDWLPVCGCAWRLSWQTRNASTSACWDGNINSKHDKEILYSTCILIAVAAANGAHHCRESPFIRKTKKSAVVCASFQYRFVSSSSSFPSWTSLLHRLLS